MSSSLVTWLRTELPLVSGGAQAVLGLIVTIGGLGASQAGVVEACVAAVLALVVAAGTKQVSSAVIAGAIQTIGVLLLTFKVAHVSAGDVSAANAFVVAVLALLVKQHILSSTMIKAMAPSPPSVLAK